MQETETKGWIEGTLKDRMVGCGTSVDTSLLVRNTGTAKKTFTVSISVKFKQRDDLIEWFFSLSGASSTQKKEEFTLSPSENKGISSVFSLEKSEQRDVRLVVATPKGAFKGDSTTVSIAITSQDNENRFEGSFTITLIPVIVAVKTTVGNEISVARDLAKKGDKDKEERNAVIKNATSEILAIMAPKEVKGYIFVETMHPDRIPSIGKGIRGYKGEVKGEISIEEIEHYLEPKPAVTGLELGAFVELIDGPFKGEKAKIMSIDTAKEEVTVQLIESMVPIPVTVNAEAIRMLDTK